MDNKPAARNRSPDWISMILWAAFLISAGVTIFFAIRAVKKPHTTPKADAQLAPTEQAAVSQEVLPTLEEDIVFQDRSNRPEPVELNLDEPVVVLITGIDKREWEERSGPGLTDVIIVAVLDAQKHTAGLLSLPRDLWVEAPEFGYLKINQIYPRGEGYGYPGGGPKLLMETVQGFLDTEIHHYVQVDYEAFVALIDAVDGVKVNVQERLIVDPDPAHKGKMKRIEPGVHVLPGDMALGYIRTRSTGEGDFGRAERQQQVLVSLQKKIFNVDIIPRLIRKAPALYRDLTSHIETNLTFSQITKLAWALKDVNPQNVERHVITQPLVEPTFNSLGEYILVPDKKGIRETWDEICNQPADVLPQPTDEPSQEERMATEKARIAVLNGTSSEGLAGETADFLSSQGLTIGRVDNADRFTETTLIYDYTGKPATIQRILELMELSENHLFHRVGEDQEEDIVIILGTDWMRENTLP
ncbi:MAG: LCP family protein [Anaerolineales bacterium]